MPKMSNGFKKGEFIPQNPQKYKGSIPIVWRSSWELRLMVWFDKNPMCITWGSETAVIQYFNPLDKTYHRYYVDFYVVMKTREGVKKFLVEVKPFCQTQKPEMHPRKKEKTYRREAEEYIKNVSKWKAAEAWAKENGMKFIVLTERELFDPPRERVDRSPS